MTIENSITKIPENTSILQTTKYTFLIPDLPFARYFCQTVTLPGISTSAVTVPTPFSDTFRHGDKLIFDNFSINAIVDEDLRVYEETYNWIVSMTFPERREQYKNRKTSNPLINDKSRTGIYFDGILTINTNSNNPNLRIKFYNCHPISLGAIQFNTTENATVIPTADITFKYDRFVIERLRED